MSGNCTSRDHLNDKYLESSSGGDCENDCSFVSFCNGSKKTESSAENSASNLKYSPIETLKRIAINLPLKFLEYLVNYLLTIENSTPSTDRSSAESGPSNLKSSPNDTLKRNVINSLLQFLESLVNCLLTVENSTPPPDCNYLRNNENSTPPADRNYFRNNENFTLLAEHNYVRINENSIPPTDCSNLWTNENSSPPADHNKLLTNENSTPPAGRNNLQTNENYSPPVDHNCFRNNKNSTPPADCNNLRTNVNSTPPTDRNNLWSNENSVASADHSDSREISEEKECDGYVLCDLKEPIVDEDIVAVMGYLEKQHYDATQHGGAGDGIKKCVYSQCKQLFEEDYRCDIVDNSGSKLCNNYPEKLIIPVARIGEQSGLTNERCISFDKSQYSDAVSKSMISRCRRRFVVPTILFDNKFICRSGTLTNWISALHGAVASVVPNTELVANRSYLGILRDYVSSRTNSFLQAVSKGAYFATKSLYSDNVKDLREAEQNVLNECNVKWICDLMVENAKTKYSCLTLGSSEKVHPEHYNEFMLEKMPYPGCEFFLKYHDNNHESDGLVFDWEDVEVQLQISEDHRQSFPDIDWNNYKEWDVNVLTKNYLKILLSILVKESGGLLVHCISGWDRTPVFISLLRLSLWADGVIHEKLNPTEMAFLTLAYDWYLFGHDLPSRLKKREEIMHFSFNFLPLLTPDEFSVTRMFEELTPEQQAGRKFPKFEPGRRQKLNTISSLILRVYKDHITSEPK